MHKPNILLLTVDTLRADMLGCYGFDKPITPNIERLAASGVRFEHAITGGSWTQAAFPTILTSDIRLYVRRLPRAALGRAALSG